MGLTNKAILRRFGRERKEQERPDLGAPSAYPLRQTEHYGRIKSFSLTMGLIVLLGSQCGPHS